MYPLHSVGVVIEFDRHRLEYKKEEFAKIFHFTVREYEELLDNYKQEHEEMYQRMAEYLGFGLKFVHQEGRGHYVIIKSDKPLPKGAKPSKESKIHYQKTENIIKIEDALERIEKERKEIKKDYIPTLVREFRNLYENDLLNIYGRLPHYIQFYFNYDFEHEHEGGYLYLKNIRYYDQQYEEIDLDLSVFHGRGFVKAKHLLKGLIQSYVGDGEYLKEVIGEEKIEI